MTDLSGTLEGVGLPAVVRFLSGLHKTGCLRITHEDWNGEVFFLDGRVVSAGLGSRRGLSALDALVQALPGGTFTFASDAEAPANTNIDLSQEALQAHLDELVARTNSGTPSLPSLDAVPHVVPLAEHAANEDTVPLDRGMLQTLLAVDGQRSVREIVSQRASFEALWQLGALADLGLVRMTRATTAEPVRMTRPTTDEPVRMTRATPDEAVTTPTPIDFVAPAQPVETPAIDTVVEPTQPARDVPLIDAPTLIGPVAAADALPTAGVHCPKLGFEDDPSSSFGRPTRLHRCYAAATPLPLSLDQQRELCLSEQFGTCPRLTSMSDATPTSPTPAPDVRRAGAFPAQQPSTPTPEPAPAGSDPRIVRLPFGGRGTGAGRGTAPDLQAVGSVGSAEPARLRPPVVNPRDGGTTRPTPLRGRVPRPNAAAATPVDDATVETPRVITDLLEPTPQAAAPAGPRQPSRVQMPGVPVPLLAGVALVAIVVALAAVLILPNLENVVEPDIDSAVLPNTSAVVAGTPVAQLPRPTVAPETAAPTAVAQAQTKPDAQPTASAPRPTAAPTTAPAAPDASAAAPSGPRMLIDESFTDNAANWPNSAQGVASVTGGTYRVLPRQTGQFVAIGAPIPDIVRDVVVSATFRKIGGPAGGGYGIIVRDQGPGPRDGSNQVGRYYVLEVGDKGEIGIWRRDGERWIDLLPWQRSDVVRPGTATNELTVRAIGDRLSLSVNGAEVATRTDTALPVGGVGLFVGGDGNQVAVDHFSVQVP
jgi:hypothetical protein